MKTELIRLMTVAALGSMMVGTAYATIAYSDFNTDLSQNQNWGRSLGMDFDVNSPILITSLGVYDTGLISQLIGTDGSSGVTVGIYDRFTGLLTGPSVTFLPGSAGTQINSDAFKSITPFVLAAGFQGSIVVFNDNNYNSQGNPNPYSTTDTGGGAISFGTTRYDNSFVYPTIGGYTPPNRFSAGTFEFEVVPVPEATTVIAGALLLLPLGASTLRILSRYGKV